MPAQPQALSPLERLLAVFTRLRPGEGRSLLLFALYGFVLLMSYYVLKTLREAFVLTTYSAEVRAYSVGAVALLLMVLVPIYGALARQIRKLQLVQWITIFFVANILLFWVLARSGVSIALFFFIWVGVFSVTAIAQFWAFAADSFNVKAGQRLFPFIMVGATAGALAGSQFTRQLAGSGLVSTVDMLLVAAAILGATLFIGRRARDAVPEDSRAVSNAMLGHAVDDTPSVFGGFAIVARDRYLMLVALLVVVINWVNTTGGAILAEFVKLEAVRRESAGLSEAGPFIAGFFGNYNTWMTLAGFTIQAFFVSRLYRWVGVSGALLLVPAIATLGYGAMSFFPVFSLIWLVKITEDSLDYSVTNTSRQAIFLPLDQESKYQGKTTIDTFFYRFGDLLQAGAVFIGLNWFGLALVEFALLNTLLAVVWLWAAWAIGREYRRRARVASANTAPLLGRPIPEVFAPPGSRLEHVLAPDTFLDRDPGDALTLSAASPGGGPLPRWLRFHSRSATFSGQVPGDHRDESTEVEVQATDFEGLSASGRLLLRHRMAVVRGRRGSDDPGEH